MSRHLQARTVPSALMAQPRSPYDQHPFFFVVQQLVLRQSFLSFFLLRLSSMADFSLSLSAALTACIPSCKSCCQFLVSMSNPYASPLLGIYTHLPGPCPLACACHSFDAQVKDFSDFNPRLKRGQINTRFYQSPRFRLAERHTHDVLNSLLLIHKEERGTEPIFMQMQSCQCDPWNRSDLHEAQGPEPLI